MSELPIPMLQGKLCVLRELRLADAPSLQIYADDECVWKNRFDGFPRPYTRADAEVWCDVGSRATGSELMWGVDVAGRVVGCISVRPDLGWMRCNAEVGYWIGQPLWRRGITSEALGMVTKWAWKALPELTRIYAPIFAWNHGSQAVARKCRFFREGEWRRSAIKANNVIDRVQWALLRPDNAPVSSQ